MYRPSTINSRRLPLQDDDLASGGENLTEAQGPAISCLQTPRMLPWTHEEDIEHYLTTFEHIAHACRWPRQDWVLHLLPLLTGKARAAYVAMEPGDSLNYGLVKQAILDKFEINVEMYGQRFRAYNAQELQVRLRDLYEKWMNPKRRTKEKCLTFVNL